MKPRITVLDDEQRMADIISMVLRRESYEVETFTDPHAALAGLEKQPVDLLLTEKRARSLRKKVVEAMCKSAARRQPITHRPTGAPQHSRTRRTMVADFGIAAGGVGHGTASERNSPCAATVVALTS